MGHLVVRQPNGLFAVLSPSGTFVLWDATRDEAAEWLTAREAEAEAAALQAGEVSAVSWGEAAARDEANNGGMFREFGLGQ